MNKIITTTTNTLEGWTIEEYHEPITADVVVRSNCLVISPWVTDFFDWGSSLRIDIDEISGKGMQMFMITALGMPRYSI